MMALNKLRLGVKLGAGVFPSLLLGGTFSKIVITALPLGLKPRHVEKFRECRLTDFGESELTDEKEETCIKHKIAFAERAI